MFAPPPKKIPNNIEQQVTGYRTCHGFSVVISSWEHSMLWQEICVSFWAFRFACLQKSMQEKSFHTFNNSTRLDPLSQLFTKRPNQKVEHNVLPSNYHELLPHRRLVAKKAPIPWWVGEEEMLLGKMMNMRRFSTSPRESGQHKKPAPAYKALRVAPRNLKKQKLPGTPPPNQKCPKKNCLPVPSGFSQVCPGYPFIQAVPRVPPGVLGWKCRKLLSTEELEQLHVTSEEEFCLSKPW